MLAEKRKNSVEPKHEAYPHMMGSTYTFWQKGKKRNEAANLKAANLKTATCKDINLLFSALPNV